MATTGDAILKYDETGNHDLVHREFDRNMKDFLLGRLISAKDFVMLARPDEASQRIERRDNTDSIYFNNLTTYNRDSEMFACGISGHQIKECPSKRQRHRPAVINSTSQDATEGAGEAAEVKTDKPSRKQKRFSNIRDGVCFACGQSGHQIEDCSTKTVDAATATWRAPGRAQQWSTNPRSGLCFECGKSGHQVKDCPSKQPLRKSAFIRPTSDQNETFQAYLRSQQAR